MQIPRLCFAGKTNAHRRSDAMDPEMRANRLREALSGITQLHISVLLRAVRDQERGRLKEGAEVYRAVSDICRQYGVSPAHPVNYVRAIATGKKLPGDSTSRPARQ